MNLPDPPITVEAFKVWFFNHYPYSFQYLVKKYDYVLQVNNINTIRSMYLLDGEVYFNELIQIAEKEKERREFARSFNNLLEEN